MATSPNAMISAILIMTGLVMAGFGLHEAGLMPGAKPFLPETAPILGYALLLGGVMDIVMSVWFARRKAG